MSEDFTQKEMLQALMTDVKGISRVLNENTGKLRSIEEEVKKTNGRVTTNEQKISRLVIDSASIKTVFYTLSTVLTVVWAAVTFFLE